MSGKFTRVVLGLTVFGLLFVGRTLADHKPRPRSKSLVTPTRKLAVKDYPSFDDDLAFRSMDVAIERQLERFRERSMKGTIRFGEDVYDRREQVRALELFRTGIATLGSCEGADGDRAGCWKGLNEFIREKFNVYVPGNRSREGAATFTAYYTPSFEASRKRTEEFPYAVYALPKEKRLRRLSRKEIDFDGKLMGRGYELFYMKNLFDIYLAQVEGSFKAVIEENGESFGYYLGYAGTNRRKWRFLYSYMRDKGMVDSKSIGGQRSYLEAHPEKQREVYSSCPSYVFFEPTTPTGSDMVQLTDNRSAALDRRIYRFKGGLVFSEVLDDIPEEGRADPRARSEASVSKPPFSRFFIDQDTGGAIRGAARADLYFGEGRSAEIGSHSLHARGNIYFLMPKKK